MSRSCAPKRLHLFERATKYVTDSPVKHWQVGEYQPVSFSWNGHQIVGGLYISVLYSIPRMRFVLKVYYCLVISEMSWYYKDKR